MASAAALNPLNSPLSKSATRKRAHESRNPQGTVIKKKPKLEDADGVVESGIARYEKLDVVGDGTYGKVYRATDTKTGEIVAMKKALRNGSSETADLREINILRSLRGHSSIVELKGVVKNQKGRNFIVMEYVENDLDYCIHATNFDFDPKWIMQQLLEGVAFIHDNGVIHRDLKPTNILMSNQGHLKICDFGFSRHIDRESSASYSPRVGTLWYRAPELLLGTRNYSTAVDMWAVGCIMAEVLTKRALFNGLSEIEQLDKMSEVLGTPEISSYFKLCGLRENVLWEKLGGAAVVSEAGVDLINKLLAYNPSERITAVEALDHDWFQED